MNPRVTRVSLLALSALCLLVISCQKKLKGDPVTPPGAPSPVELRFQHVVTPFRDLLFDSTYHAPGLVPFEVTAFKYYISNMEFVNSNTGDTIKIPDTYFLVDHSNASSMKPQFNIPSGEYYNLSFLIGIDHNRNMNGPRTGALDPANGMFWNATDGHIMALLEGTSPVSTLPGNVFTFQVGGTKDPFSVLARRHFKLGGNISVSPNRKTVINLKADVITWFSNPHSISLTTSCTAPGDLSNKIAENYFKMFDFVSVKYE